MILVCPACSTRYLVPDTAIGIEGRQVRCANCKNSWFAEGAESIPVTPAPPQAPPRTPVQQEFPETSAQESYQDEPRVEKPVTKASSSYGSDPFAHEPPFKPRRNPAKMWTAIAVGLFLVLAAGIGAVAWFGPPSFIAGIGGNAADSALDVQLVRSPERRTLASGHELLSISGRIVNMTDEEQPVPDIRAELRNAQGAVVYDWTIQAPQTSLPPREMVEFNSAEIDIPRNAEELNLKFVPFEGG